MISDPHHIAGLSEGISITSETLTIVYISTCVFRLIPICSVPTFIYNFTMEYFTPLPEEEEG